jgi:hypothetical protein
MNNTATYSKPLPPSRDQIKTTVSFLNRSFREASDGLKIRLGTSSNVKGSALYGYQTDFAYIIDNIQRSAPFMVVQYTAEANALIERMASHQKGD